MHKSPGASQLLGFRHFYKIFRSKSSISARTSSCYSSLMDALTFSNVIFSFCVSKVSGCSFHLMSQSAMSIWFSMSSGVALLCRRLLTEIFRSGKSLTFLHHSLYPSTSGKATTSRPKRTFNRSLNLLFPPVASHRSFSLGDISKTLI